ncbi:MAG: ABC transporter ATP-binding protein [Clostridia bacterium]|nr:ABC transporter ATP-binding protein [Clostridia bacterium]
MLIADALTRTYPMGSQTLTALDRVSFHIPQGEYAAIVGPSGSGKSTLMHLLGCLDSPTSGSYRLHGRDVSRLSGKELARVRGAEIGFVFQGFQLIPRLTALENVALPMLLCGIPAKARNARAELLLARVGLADRLHHKSTQLSGGQQQRVAIARALSRDPAVLLADEPTGSLDPRSTREVLALLDELHREGHTVVLITHDMKVAAQADRQLEIAGGRLVADRRRTAKAQASP